MTKIDARLLYWMAQDFAFCPPYRFFNRKPPTLPQFAPIEIKVLDCFATTPTYANNLSGGPEE
ncbi:hypothetical protein L0Z64_01570 [Phaeobacter sp. BS23]|uniref:hypothetical protein n=1 Tax=Phaeobacter sp. BS23 TaxID=2907239 RepID=UPI00386A0D3E